MIDFLKSDISEKEDLLPPQMFEHLVQQENLVKRTFQDVKRSVEMD